MAKQPDTKGSGYKSQEANWTKVQAIANGESAVKDAGEVLLPKLSGQTPQKYKAYKDRGTFYNIFSRTVRGFVGAIIQKEPKAEVSESLKKLLPSLTLQKESFREVVRLSLQKIIEYGYMGILADMPINSDESPIGELVPYLSIYNAESIINYQIGKDGKLSMVCLKEIVQEVDLENEFATIAKTQIRVLRLDDQGFLVVQVYKKVEKSNSEIDWTQEADVLPKIMGKRLDYIPFVFFGAISNNPNPENPPLMDLVYLNIKHWQVTVDYYHGLHFCAIPTPWAAGFPADTELNIGGEQAWVSEEPTASCGYLEFSGAGLAAVKTALDGLEKQMAVMGARILLEDQKRAAETEETMRIRGSGDTATLSTIVNSTEEGFEKALGYMEMWMGKEPSEIAVELNKEFASAKLSAQDITALLQAYQAGGISLDTFLWNMKTGERLQPDTTVEDEKILIENGMASSFGNIDEEGNPII